MDTSHREHGSGNLPLEINTMVGRRQEVVDIRRLMESCRLVTLTGPGGIGKTRTSLHVARTTRRTFADGAWLVELGSVTDSGMVAQALLETLKVNESSSRDPRDVVSDHLRGRHVLLVLDNCEHLIDEVAALVGSLLQELAGVHVLATSRQPLGVPGEAVYGLGPLPLPDLDALAARDGMPAAAVELFALRAQAALGEFEITPSNRLDVARLCVRLEGLPLAIELAAARLQVMTIEELLQRLDERFRMLKHARHVGTERHQTLAATVAWSYDLCTPEERLLWCRASVFRGTFSLEAAEVVAADDDLPRDEVMEALQGLVDKSVVRAETVHGRRRFAMLETIREYGAERLVEAGAADRLKRAHLAWMLSFVRGAAETWFGPHQADVLEQLDIEQANLRAALELCWTHTEHARTGLELAGRPWFHWIASGHLPEGRMWLGRLLEADPAPTEERSLALGTTAFIATMQGEPDRGAEAAALCEELGAQLGVPLARAVGIHIRFLAEFLVGGQPELAESLFQEGERRYAAADGNEALVSGLANSMEVQHAAMLVLLGDTERAARRLSRFEAAMDELGEQWLYSHALWMHGVLCLTTGDVEEAERLLLRSIQLKMPFGDYLGLAIAVDAYAWVLAARGTAEQAAHAVGVATALWSTIGNTLLGSAYFTERRAECETRARADLGDEAFDDAVRRGAALPLHRALAGLVGSPSNEPQVERPVAAHSAAVLTRREREVAGLVADGLSNAEIAGRLVISQRTAEGHVDHILRKLDFRSRAQIAAWVAAQS